MRRDRERTVAKAQTSWFWLICLVIASGTFAWYVIYLGRGTILAYDMIDQLQAKTNAMNIIQVELPDSSVPLFIPSFSPLRTSGTWVFVSKKFPLPTSYQPSNLAPTQLAHAASDTPVQLDRRVNAQLSALFEQARSDGYPLMIASAYRSISDQQKVYDEFVAARGEALAQQYVAQPGSSEHHTGLGVDVDDETTACGQDADRCTLSPDTSAWIEKNAPHYGFIVRYPAGKQPVTGVAYEPWHLRYVGVTLAKQLSASNLSFDEFIAQILPSRTP